ncbi:hypothetical protein V6N13_084493 [Hibiscus sabdariffa]|uniref:Uncharacterized protein n=1 Tax=Hibiscus sabdariffa TaxID=183260 RepID=A0ABR2T1U0_9ROSI
MDVAADDSSASLDSLSFAGLVCIHDQQSGSDPSRAYNDKVDLDFEFVSSTNPPSLDGSSSSKASIGSHRNRGKKERSGSRSWFGQKLFSSFVSTCRCRECHALTPTMKTQAVPQGSGIKLL